MRLFTALDKLNSAAKVIHDYLKCGRVPPFCGEIEFSTRHDDPEWTTNSCFLNLRDPSFFTVVQMNITLELRDWDSDVQLFFEELNVSMNEVIRDVVRVMNQRVMHLDHTDAAIVFIEWRDVRIVLPELRTRSTDVGQKLLRVSAMQVSNRRSEHHNVTGRERRFENQALHSRLHEVIGNSRCQFRLSSLTPW